MTDSAIHNRPTGRPREPGSTPPLSGLATPIRETSGLALHDALCLGFHYGPYQLDAHSTGTFFTITGANIRPDHLGFHLHGAGGTIDG